MTARLERVEVDGYLVLLDQECTQGITVHRVRGREFPDGRRYFARLRVDRVETIAPAARREEEELERWRAHYAAGPLPGGTGAQVPAVVDFDAEDEVDRSNVLDQDVWWIDRDGARHRVSGMEPRYCRNVLRFLERQADEIADTHAWNLTTMTMPAGHTQAWVDVDRAMSSEFDLLGRGSLVWLREQPLYRALKERAEEDEAPWW
ncbi:hypothetical protein ACFC1T_09080 [Kitasatospora sp. NPDC056076]|uniref:hypothetical protein n=1 Tax=Kitasatospora sp. NPDC056076 TaxID=3345703 RepID=UPI0035DA6631